MYCGETGHPNLTNLRHNAQYLSTISDIIKYSIIQNIILSTLTVTPMNPQSVCLDWKQNIYAQATFLLLE